MRKNILILWVLLSGSLIFNHCNRIIEPIAHGDYYVTNATKSNLIIAASGNFGSGEAKLLTDEIGSGDKIHIYTFTEGSGGHVMPSNAWSDFIVYAGHKSDSTIIYSGIDNSDWEYQGSNQAGHLIYNLTIN